MISCRLKCHTPNKSFYNDFLLFSAANSNQKLKLKKKIIALFPYNFDSLPLYQSISLNNISLFISDCEKVEFKYLSFKFAIPLFSSSTRSGCSFKKSNSKFFSFNWRNIPINFNLNFNQKQSAGVFHQRMCWIEFCKKEVYFWYQYIFSSLLKKIKPTKNQGSDTRNIRVDGHVLSAIDIKANAISFWQLYN